jgi:hypothetical protein
MRFLAGIFYHPHLHSPNDRIAGMAISAFADKLLD